MSSSNSSSRPPSLLRRIPMAFGAFFGVMFNAELAQRYAAAGEPAVPVPQPPSPPPASMPPPPPAILLKEAPADAALQLLGLLQRDARLIDFVQESVADYSDADVGAAARLVHEGCRKVLAAHFTLAPVRSENEGSHITLPVGFDAAAVRLTGHVVGQAPFTGTLSHRGWRVTDVHLPQRAEHHDAAIVAQAEVEL